MFGPTYEETKRPWGAKIPFLMPSNMWKCWCDSHGNDFHSLNFNPCPTVLNRLLHISFIQAVLACLVSHNSFYRQVQ